MSTVKFPFEIANGSVAVTSLDREAIRSQLLFCLGTQVNERVMRPSWGIDIMSTLYAVGGDLAEAVPEAVADMFRRWFPTYRFIAASVEIDPQRPNWATVTVRWGQIDSEVDEVLRQDVPLVERGVT
jgi:phage baseplate assembly protein W